MMPWKLQGVLVLAALLIFSRPPTEAKVVTSVAECAEFFLQETPPHIPGILEDGRILDQNRYKPICQTYKKSRTFVTLYDTKNKIPVFSAAMYKGFAGKRPDPEPWSYEPQLEDTDSMQSVWLSLTQQSGMDDYHQENRTFDKGHLLPSSYGQTEEEKKSTFTLTNVVPQQSKFNQGSWSRMESCVRCVLDQFCISHNKKTEAFVVIGAQPSNGILLNGKVNIPSKLWSAFCCYSRSQNRWLASAHWGENIPDDTNDKYLQTKTLAELNSELGGQFNAFPGGPCPLRTTVSELYPNLKKKKQCKCPPPDPRTTAPPTTTPFTMTSNPSMLHTSTSGLSTTSSASQPTTTTKSLTTTTAPATAPDTTTASTARTTTTTLTTTTKKKKDEAKQDGETNQRENTNNLGEGSGSGTGGLLEGITGIGGAEGGIFGALGTGIGGGNRIGMSSLTDPPSKNEPPGPTTNSKTSATTIKSVIYPTDLIKAITFPKIIHLVPSKSRKRLHTVFAMRYNPQTGRIECKKEIITVDRP